MKAGDEPYPVDGPDPCRVYAVALDQPSKPNLGDVKHYVVCKEHGMVLSMLQTEVPEMTEGLRRMYEGICARVRSDRQREEEW